MKFRKKPIEIEAFQWLPELSMCWPNWATSDVLTSLVQTDTFDGSQKHTLLIRTLEGPLTASPGDWIIRGIKGEIYSCKPDIFAATYEAIE